MFDTLIAVRSALETTANTVDVARLEGPVALRLVEELGAIRRLTDGLIAAASRGIPALQDACLKARNAVEDEPARRKRQHRERSLRTWTGNYDGMLHGSFTLTPETGAQIKAVIDSVAQTLFRNSGAVDTPTSREQHAADAFTRLILEYQPAETAHTQPDTTSPPESHVASRSKTRSRVKYNVHIVIDHEVLQRGSALPGERSEIPGVGPVNTQWVRDILGDAFVTAIIGKGKDIRTIAHLGRHINTELRTALIASGRECDIDGCHSNQYLEIDHSEVDHAQHGPTAWWNLGWLCYQHHRLKSQGWTLNPRAPSGKRTLNPPQQSAA